MNRREFCQGGLLLAAAMAGSAGRNPARGASTPSQPAGKDDRRDEKRPFLLSLNTSTLRAHKLPITQTIDIAARCGYRGIEPWPDELDRHVESGGTLKDLRKRLDDVGLRVTGAIAFYEWMVDDDQRRARGVEEARRRMEQLGQIGATHMAAPPSGDVAKVEPAAAAQRYHELLKLADQSGTGVVPALEIWGKAARLSELAEAVYIAMKTHHPKACILPDAFHLYTGGSDLSNIALVSPRLLAGFHLNDYPADPPRGRIADRDRVYPGDGIAPLKTLLRDLSTIGYRGPLSIELFNPAHARQDPMVVARTALEKTNALIAAAIG